MQRGFRMWDPCFTRADARLSRVSQFRSYKVGSAGYLKAPGIGGRASWLWFKSKPRGSGYRPKHIPYTYMDPLGNICPQSNACRPEVAEVIQAQLDASQGCAKHSLFQLLGSSAVERSRPRMKELGPRMNENVKICYLCLKKNRSRDEQQVT